MSRLCNGRVLPLVPSSHGIVGSNERNGEGWDTTGYNNNELRQKITKWGKNPKNQTKIKY